MDTVSPRAPKDKPHYVYTLAYPENYPKHEKAGTVFYVGKGIGDRIDEHEKELRLGKEKNKHKCNIIRKIWANDGQVLKRIVACFKTDEEAIQYEIALIFFMDGLTNLTWGGEGAKPDEETRRKLSESHKGQVWSIESRQRLSRAITGRKMGPMSIEARQKLSEANIGKVLSEACRQKIGESLRGHPVSENTRQKLSKAQKGKSKWSIEDRRKIGEKQKGRSRGPYSEEHCRNISTAKMGHSVSEATRQKISEANRSPSPERRKRRSSAHLGQIAWNKGRLMSEEAKRKLSESQKKRLAAKKQAKDLQTSLTNDYIQGRLFP